MTDEQNGAHSARPDDTPVDRRTPAAEPPVTTREEDRRDRHMRVLPHHERNARDRGVVDERSVAAAQKQEHGGVKVGSAFFGWLTATGMAVLLTALLSAIGAGVGVANDTSVGNATDTAVKNASTVGIVGAIVLLAIVLIAYYCGGYVAGRMARFNGIRQGIAVWLWGLVIVVVLAILAAAAGQKYNVLAKLNAFPRIPVNEGTLTTTGVIALVAVAAASLLGAILGGLAGMRYHRVIDRTRPVVD